jgi:hypothetical protein
MSPEIIGKEKFSFTKKEKMHFQKFSELDFPTIKDEEWKYTNIISFLQHNFTPSYQKKES